MCDFSEKWRFHVVLAAFVCVSFFGRTVAATPVTLAFEAEITAISLEPSFDSGIAINAGSMVLGQFTFDPFEDDCTVSGGLSPVLGCTIARGQLSPFLLVVDNIALRSPEFEITSSNDSVIEDFAPANIIDMISLKGDGLEPINSSNAMNIDPAVSAFRMTLRGTTESIDSASAPGMPEAWNRFQFERSLSVALRDGKGGVASFRAEIGEFAIIPEPSSWCLANLLLAIIFYLGSRNFN